MAFKDDPEKIVGFALVPVGSGVYRGNGRDLWIVSVYPGSDDYTADIKGAYEFYKKGNYTVVGSLGYRLLRMNMKGTQDNGSWFQEDDHYNGPFLSVLVKYTEFAK